MLDSVSITAPAKVNLCLHITGKRADGFHLLESLTVFTDFGDQLELTSAPEITLSVTGPYAAGLVHDKAPNLAIRAAQLLQHELGITEGVHIHLDKQIPIGAGLGGGSADAAAVLRALPELWGKKISQDRLLNIAAQLGSDVPACLISQPVWMRGAGEQLEYLALPIRGSLLLVNPNVHVATADVYRAYRPPFSPSPTRCYSADNLYGFTSWLGVQHNALAQPAQYIAPEIRRVLSTMSRQEGCMLARMSGSGATCFGVFLNDKKAQAAQAAIAQQYPDWWLQATRWRNGDTDGQA